MGNNPSTTSKSNTASPAGSTHGSSGNSSVRREPRLRDSVNTAQRIAAEPVFSRTNVTHRTRNSQSHHAHFDSHSPSPKEHTGSYQSRSSESHKTEVRDEPSKPVAVPIPSSTPSDSTSVKSPYSMDSQIDPSGPPTDAMSYHLSRPPRLPLPIEEEVHTPGSPILAATAADSTLPEIQSLDESETEGLPRRSSALSNVTGDDDDDGDAEELPIDRTKPVVPTEFLWLGGGEKVYVTGTIFQWSRKSKLYPVPNKPGVLSAIIQVRPGTHHIRFIVDGNMTISPDLPTTVDFGNNLVNYIEVSADDVPQDMTSKAEALGTPVASEDKTLQAPAQTQEEAANENVPPKPTPKHKPVIPQARYSKIIPQYLLDLDKAEDSTAYQYAAAAIEKLPTPPSLPGFLGKPILNAATPMKDDNSVLNMPNHTVLNHLATSSIKNNILAVSATTRYKRKYVTTIMYKPTTEDTA